MTRRRKPLCTTTLPKMLKHRGIPAIAHGLRSACHDWAAEETDHPREVIEAVLAHASANVMRQLIYMQYFTSCLTLALPMLYPVRCR